MSFQHCASSPRYLLKVFVLMWLQMGIQEGGVLA